MRKTTLGVKILATRPSELDGLSILDVWVSPDASIWWLGLAGVPDYRTVEDGATFPKLEADSANRFLIVRQSAGGIQVTEIPETKRNFHFVRPIGADGEFMLVCGRAADENDRNARCFSNFGHPSRAFHLGDGIQDIQVTPDGGIWTSYFDEGVCSEVPMGSSGLVLNDASGKKLWGYNEHLENGSRGFIDDCYALNAISQRSAYVCPYADFPLVHCGLGKSPQILGSSTVKGPHAIAVSKSFFLLYGGYNDRTALTLARRGGGKSRRCQTDRPIPKPAFVVYGRGPILYLASEDQVAAIHIP